MRISDIIETAGVGRVVPGVNMPKGIHPDEITRQAARFGNRVDRDGRPPITSTNGRDALREKSQTTNTKPTGLKLSEAPVPGTKFVSLDRAQLEEALAYLQELGEHINGDSIKYADHPAISAKLDRDYKAITAVEYVMRNNLKALKDTKLAEKSIFLYDVEDSDLSYMDFVGGIHVVLEDGVAEAKWIGSYDADGTGLLRAAMKIAKARGAKEMKLDAKWESEGFYTKMGFQQTGPTVHRVFSGTSLTPFKKELEERWSKRYKKSIDCTNPKGFSQRAHCAGRKVQQHVGKPRSGHVNENRMDDLVETMLHSLLGKGLAESHAVTIIHDHLDEDLRKWFRQKWVRFGPDGKIRGACARDSQSEGKPKCLPQSKAHALGKKGRATAAGRKRREDPDADRRGKAKNVATKEHILDNNDPNISEKKDACYHKVKRRYKVWPSAYASGALVQCRKKGAKNWGKKS